MNWHTSLLVLQGLGFLLALELLAFVGAIVRRTWRGAALSRQECVTIARKEGAQAARDFVQSTTYVPQLVENALGANAGPALQRAVARELEARRIGGR